MWILGLRGLNCGLRYANEPSNWNLEVLVFMERGKPEYPGKNLSEQRGEPTTNSTHLWRRRQDLTRKDHKIKFFL